MWSVLGKGLVLFGLFFYTICFSFIGSIYAIAVLCPYGKEYFMKHRLLFFGLLATLVFMSWIGYELVIVATGVLR